MHCDSDNKLLAKLNNVYLTQFNDGRMFNEVSGKKKELFKILNVSVPSVEQVLRIDSEEDEMPSEDCGIEDLESKTIRRICNQNAVPCDR